MGRKFMEIKRRKQKFGKLNLEKNFITRNMWIEIARMNLREGNCGSEIVGVKWQE